MADYCIPGFTITHPETAQDFQLCNVANQWTRYELTLSDTEQPSVVLPEQLFQVYPTLGRMSQGEKWQLFLQLTDRIVMLNPTVMFWKQPNGKRSTVFDPAISGQSLYLEFLFEPGQNELLQATSLVLAEAPDLTLANQINPIAIQQKISQIDQWLTYYTSITPLAISLQGLVKSKTEIELNLPASSALSLEQLHLIYASLMAYQATFVFNHRQRALTLAEALINYFYRTLPITPDTQWYPHWLVNAGASFTGQGAIADEPEHYGCFDVVVEFVDGVGQLPDDQLARVFKVYSGQLADRRVDAALSQGQSYPVDYWIDSNNIAVQAPAQTEESIDLNKQVIYGYRDDIRLILAYSVFVFAII